MGIHSEMVENFDDCLMVAVEVGDVEEVINLIENYKHNIHKYKYPPKINECLIKSVENENWTLTNLFLTKYNADVNAEKVNNGRTRAIHIAAASGNIDIAKEVLNRGSLVNITDGNGKYPLQLAVEQNHTKMVELLVNEGASINRGPSARLTKWEHPIHTSIKCHNWDIFDILIKKGARINTVNYKGETCVHYAIKYQQFVILQKLCERGADLNIGNPLRAAVMHNSFQMAATLIQYGAKVNTANHFGETVLNDLPMVYKKDVNRNEEIHQFVYDKIMTGSKGKINSRDMNDFTPLHHAVMAGTLEIIQKFLELGADINATTRRGNLAPLHFAIGPGGSAELAIYLIDNGARTDILPNKNNDQGIFRGGENLLNQLVLSASAEYFNPLQIQLLNILIEQGSQINYKDDRNCTPLERYVLLANASFWAGMRETSLRNKEVIAIFVAAGAKLSQIEQKNRSRLPLLRRQSEHHVSPLCRVTWYGDFSTSRFLIDSGVDITKEKWIHFQGKTPEVESYLCELREVAKVPSKLMLLCRRFIRERMSYCNNDTDVRPCIKRLPLPSSMINFLKLNDEIMLYLQNSEQ